jgi:uncharacterized membrane protein YoaK (UPF0700 family)
MGGPITSDKGYIGWGMLTISFHKALGVNTVVGWILSFWSGAVNTVTTLAILFERASHVSGRLNDVGMNIVLHPIDALLVFVIWISFCFGGFLAGKMLNRIGLTRSLFTVAMGVGIGALLVWAGYYATGEDDYGIGRMIIAFFLPTVMGIQNGLTSMLSQVGRSTHWTGDSTDMGLALARGDFTAAAHRLLKIFGFCCGAATSAYLIEVRGLSPLYSLTAIAAGYFFTVIILWRINRALPTGNSNK